MSDLLKLNLVLSLIYYPKMLLSTKDDFSQFISLSFKFIIVFIVINGAKSMGQTVTNLSHNNNTYINNSTLSWSLEGNGLDVSEDDFQVLKNDTQTSDVTISVNTVSTGTEFTIDVTISSELVHGDSYKLRANINENTYIATNNYKIDSEPPTFSTVVISTDNDSDGTQIEDGNIVLINATFSESISSITATLDGQDMSVAGQDDGSYNITIQISPIPNDLSGAEATFEININDQAGNYAITSATTNNSRVYYADSEMSVITFDNTISAPSTEHFCSNSIEINLVGSEVDPSDISPEVTSVTYQWESNHNNNGWSDISGATSKDYYINTLDDDGDYEFRRKVNADGEDFHSNEVDITVQNVENYVVNLFPSDATYPTSLSTPIDLSTDVESDEVTLTCSGSSVRENQFFPNEAGVGQHTVTYRLEDENCSKEYTKVFHVYDEGNTLNLGSSKCSNSDDVVLSTHSSLTGFEDYTIDRYEGTGLSSDGLSFVPSSIFSDDITSGTQKNITITAFFEDASGTVVDSVKHNFYVVKTANVELNLPSVKRYFYSDDVSFLVTAIIDNEDLSDGYYFLDDTYISSGSYTIDPSTLELGEHTIRYDYITDNDCVIQINKQIEIVERSTSSLVLLNGSYCSSESAQDITLVDELPLPFSQYTFQNFTVNDIETNSFTPANYISSDLPYESSTDVVIKAHFTYPNTTIIDSIVYQTTVYKESVLSFSPDLDTVFVTNDTDEFHLELRVNGENDNTATILQNNSIVGNAEYVFLPRNEGNGTYNFEGRFTGSSYCEIAKNLVIVVTDPPPVFIPIVDEDSIALKNLYDELNITYDASTAIQTWPYYSSNEDGRVTELLLYGINNLRELPDEINQLRDLEIIKAYNSDLETLSDSIWTLPNLWFLDVSNNRLRDEDLQRVNELDSLRTFFFHHNDLDQVPNLAGLNNLMHVLGSHNNIQSLTNQLDNCNALRILDLSYNNISEIDDFITGKSELNHLNLSHNTLDGWAINIPDQLQTIDLSNNRLATIVSLPNESQINVSYNRLFFDELEKLTSSDMNYASQSSITSFVDQKVVKGNDYTYNLENTIEGVVYQWYKEDQLMGTSLSISNFQLDDIGTYQCKATHSDWDNLEFDVLTLTLSMNCSIDENFEISSSRHSWFCNDEDISIQLLANPHDTTYTYSWYKDNVLIDDSENYAYTAFEEGTYKVKVINNEGCSSYSNSFTVLKNDSIATPQISFSDRKIQIANLDTLNSYIWYHEDQMFNDTSQVIYPHALGEYTVIAVDSNGCEKSSSILSITDNDQVTSVTANYIASIKVYPNPTSNTITLESAQQIKQITVFDIYGRTVLMQDHLFQTLTIDVTSLVNGMYIGEILDFNGVKTSIKFQKE
ncbi:T9SS type A sorting domain-containing protein [Flammeovirga sp. SubArs3]|uniref:T9SS type A sorting domain-containing protein n=1 Tax=Flammeovirga sp. SubArs3 TaxID=2995316 RepID=UPI00248D0194|nr:T9SS type A sorting domain-containing protein [Flammeovirga sp. SubArs3]